MCNIVITKADKCNQIGLLDKKQYIDGMKNLINDVPYRFYLVNHPHKNHHKSNSSLFFVFYFINLQKTVCLLQSNCAEVYALLKVDKPNISCCPIVVLKSGTTSR